MADRIQYRRDTAARWAEFNPVLLEGEVGYVTDNPNQYKIGDGVNAWNDLPLRGYTGTISQGIGNDENAVMSQKIVSDLTGLSEYTAFSENKDYAVGDVVNKDGKLYEFIVAHAAGAWLGTDAEETSVKKKLEKKDIELEKTTYPRPYISFSDFKIEKENWSNSVISFSSKTRLILNDGTTTYIGSVNKTSYTLNNFECLCVDVTKINRNNEKDNPTEVNVYSIQSSDLDSNKIVLAYRNNKQIIDGILLTYHINSVINQNKSQVFISSVNLVKIEDYTQKSDITINGSFKLFLSNNRSIYVNYEEERTFSLNNFEAAYIDLEDVSYGYAGDTEHLVTIKTGSFINLFTDNNKIILAYRSGNKVEGGCIFSHKASYINDVFAIFADNSTIVSKEYSNRNDITISNSIRLYTKGYNFYISGTGEKEFTLNNFEVAYVDIDLLSHPIGSPAEIKIASFSSSLDWYSDKVILLYRDAQTIRGGLLYEYLQNEKISKFEESFYNIVEVELVNGSYIHINGNIHPSSTSDVSYSRPFKLVKGEELLVSAIATPLTAVISETDENGTYYNMLVPGRNDNGPYSYLATKDCYVAISFINSGNNSIKKTVYAKPTSGTSSSVSTNGNPYFKQNINNTPILEYKKQGILLYEGDNKVEENHIVNAVIYPNGEIIAVRSGGRVVKIGYEGETELLNIPGATDWRGVYMDSNLNVFISPYDSYSSIASSKRGIYKLNYGESEFNHVLKLYNPDSDISTEIEDNRDTIWTFCEDDKGNLYAGTYSLSHENPSVYKSTDGGDTWKHIINFNDKGHTSGGKHVHSIIFNKYNRSLYVIVGEINTIFKSKDYGETWENLNITLTVKGSSMIAVQDGILIGSDGAYHCDIDMLMSDDKTHKKVSRIWANTIFAIRQSDLTGYLYAFTKIDSSVNVLTYYPPIEAIEDEGALESWKESQEPSVVSLWEDYNNTTKDFYPKDCIRPQHCSILISKDFGKTWEVLYRVFTGSQNAAGFWTAGYFYNGECLTGFVGNDQKFKKPIIISEGKHQYKNGNIDLSTEIFSKTNNI